MLYRFTHCSSLMSSNPGPNNVFHDFTEAEKQSAMFRPGRPPELYNHRFPVRPKDIRSHFFNEDVVNREQRNALESELEDGKYFPFIVSTPLLRSMFLYNSHESSRRLPGTLAPLRPFAVLGGKEFRVKNLDPDAGAAGDDKFTLAYVPRDYFRKFKSHVPAGETLKKLIYPDQHFGELTFVYSTAPPHISPNTRLPPNWVMDVSPGGSGSVPPMGSPPYTLSSLGSNWWEVYPDNIDLGGNLGGNTPEVVSDLVGSGLKRGRKPSGSGEVGMSDPAGLQLKRLKLANKRVSEDLSATIETSPNYSDFLSKLPQMPAFRLSS